MRVGAEDRGRSIIWRQILPGKCGGGDRKRKGDRPGPQSGCGGWDAPASFFSHVYGGKSECS